MEEIVELGEIKPREVHTPGIYVDRIYKGSNYRKSFDDTIVRKFNAKANPTREKIAKRAVKEIQKGMYINLGIGIPTLISNFLPKDMDIYIQSENGLLGVGPFAKKEDANFDLINASMAIYIYLFIIIIAIALNNSLFNYKIGKIVELRTIFILGNNNDQPRRFNFL